MIEQAPPRNGFRIGLVVFTALYTTFFAGGECAVAYASNVSYQFDILTLFAHSSPFVKRFLDGVPWP